MADKGLGKPISSASLQVLLALSAQPLHGYGIIKEVERQSRNQYRIGPGTLYDTLNRLINQGYVDDIPSVDESPETKRMYRVTKTGGALLASELKRMGAILRLGRKRLRNLSTVELI